MTEPRVRSKPSAAGSPSVRPSAGGSPKPGSEQDDVDTLVGPRFAVSEAPPKFTSMRAPPPESQRASSGRERILTHRVQLAAGAFWMWLAVATLVAVVAAPINDDANTMAALKEASAFAAAFDKAALEASLRAHANTVAGVALPKVAQRITGRGVPKVTASPGAIPIAPYTKLDFPTLSQVESLTSPNAKLALEVPAADSIGEALAWRLSRTEGSDRFTLQSVTLAETGCSAADLAREQQIGRMRTAVTQARAQATAAEQRQLSAEKAYEARRKWKASWKVIAQANEKRVETKAALEQAQQQLMAAGAAYDAATEQALHLPDSAGDGTCRIAVAKLAPKSGTDSIEFRVPARVERRSVAAPKIAGADFPVAKRTGLWPLIAGSTPPLATAQLSGRFSWHNRYSETAGIKLGGMTILQLIPTLTLAILFLLIRTCRRATATYNPFDPPMIAKLPSVGFSARWLDAVLLVGLPLTGCAMCSWALIRIDQVPVVPVLCAIASVGVGAYAYITLRKLLDLRDAILLSHRSQHPTAR